MLSYRVECLNNITVAIFFLVVIAIALLISLRLEMKIDKGTIKDPDLNLEKGDLENVKDLGLK